ncbi:MAG: nicotinamide riboside transporter PnuC [Saprospiraceae bacterium]
MSILEAIAAGLGVISVWFIVRRNVWAFPIGIVMVSLYILVFYRAKFYADMGLQVIYIGMQIQGWILWTRGKKAIDQKIAIRRLSRIQWLYTLGVILAGTALIGYLLSIKTDAALPYIDALTTVISLTAQWWMNKKYLGNWVLWIVVDCIYLYQYSFKELYLTTGLYAVFLVLAILGYQEWKREEFQEQERDFTPDSFLTESK